MKTGLLLDAIFKEHLTGNHPECPERIAAIQSALEPLLPTLSPIPTRIASDDEILLLHSREYLEMVNEDMQAGRTQLSTGDTVLSPNSLSVAQQATGGVLNALDQIVAGNVQNAFCAVRPPGHHATPNRGMGFCIFNHIAITARYAQAKGLSKILIVDWDVHHGNGTQDAFYRDDSVLFFSSHQHPWYPGTGMKNETGAGAGLGYTVNAPLPAFSGFTQIHAALEARLEPKLTAFKPDLILLSAGFDSRIDDPLGRFTVQDEEFASLTRLLQSYAHDYCGDRLLSILEGGYNLRTLGSAVLTHVTALQQTPAVPQA